MVQANVLSIHRESQFLSQFQGFTRRHLHVTRILVAMCLLATTLPALAKKKKQQDTATLATQVVVTVVPKKHEADQIAEIASKDIIVKQNYKSATVLDWTRLPAQVPIQLVIFIDDSLQARSSLEFADLKTFIAQLPPNVQVAIGYMQDGRALIVSGFTPDRAATARSIRLPTGIIAVDASPYFCLSDLAKHWPAPSNSGAVRQVLMITDGIDRYFSPRQYNPEDPYVATAITDSQKSHLIVSSIYFRDLGYVDRGMNAAFIGDSNLLEVAKGTGGTMYSSGLGDPVTFVPYLNDFTKRLARQYVVTFLGHGSGLQSLEINTKVPDVKLDATRGFVAGQHILPIPY